MFTERLYRTTTAKPLGKHPILFYLPIEDSLMTDQVINKRLKSLSSVFKEIFGEIITKIAFWWKSKSKVWKFFL